MNKIRSAMGRARYAQIRAGKGHSHSCGDL